MIACDFPFNGANVDQLSNEIKTKEVDFSSDEFKSVSEECKDLIRNLLKKDKNERFNVQQALDHPWFANSHKNNHVILESTKNKAMKCLTN